MQHWFDGEYGEGAQGRRDAVVDVAEGVDPPPTVQARSGSFLRSTSLHRLAQSSRSSICKVGHCFRSARSDHTKSAWCGFGDMQPFYNAAY